jgi:hypothetical protein
MIECINKGSMIGPAPTEEKEEVATRVLLPFKRPLQKSAKNPKRNPYIIKMRNINLF